MPLATGLIILQLKFRSLKSEVRLAPNLQPGAEWQVTLEK